jgi:5'-AMP-activated protein kinase catalytic alpha subunit
MPKKVGKYEIGKTLGEGTFGKVKRAVNTEDQRVVAIKVLDKDKIQKQNMGSQIKKEISIMKMVKHPNVVELVEVLASKTKIFIVLELVTGGELFDEIVKEGKLIPEDARMYFRQLCEAVLYCHSKGVSHRDLKPENLLLDANGDLKISDFGLSALVRGDGDQTRAELLHTTCGTPNYVAPEVLADNGYDGPAADTWSCGVILYVLLAGFLPFDEPTMSALFRKIGKADFSYPTWFEPEVRDLLDRIMVVDPSTRLTLEQILEHAWMQVGVQEVDGDNKSTSRKSFSRGASSKGNLNSAPSKQQMDDAIADAGLDDEQDFSEAVGEDMRLEVNVFDVINRVACDGLTRLFDSTSATKEARRIFRYLTAKNPDETFAVVSGIVGGNIERINMALQRHTVNTSKGAIGINVTCRQMAESPVMYLVEVTKGRGGLLQYAEAVGQFDKALGPALK